MWIVHWDSVPSIFHVVCLLSHSLLYLNNKCNIINDYERWIDEICCLWHTDIIDSRLDATTKCWALWNEKEAVDLYWNIVWYHFIFLFPNKISIDANSISKIIICLFDKNDYNRAIFQKSHYRFKSAYRFQQMAWFDEPIYRQVESP